jgi:hypothetical protein
MSKKVVAIFGQLARADILPSRLSAQATVFETQATKNSVTNIQQYWNGCKKDLD